MRIVQQTPTYLKLQENRLLTQLWRVAIALPFVFSGLASMVLLGETAELMCDRTTPTEVSCQISNQTLLRKSQTPLPPLKGAEVETRSNAQGQNYRISLLTSGQRIPLTQGWSPSQDDRQMEVDAINVFLEDPSQPSFNLKQDARWFAYPLGLLFVGLGGVILATGWNKAHPDLCTFDRRSKQIQWQRTIAGSSVDRRELTFQDVEEVRVFRSKDGESDRPYTTRLILQSGEMLPLMSSADQNQQLELASTINRFLGINPRRPQA
ncbi:MULTISPECIES: hypothetical protein [unclassified Leptolyngbya]|uniref:hypothetical protein n=1 Tax=unclassified Leptolyngbya TaxID=2650499 RepID=UPI001683CB72|nr:MULTISPECIES: hypothetical protein [unclassified Leptolyngbya]MBD1910537.1 hypothetical protein [Leptolyngbya sp. FACHB-8]MBD2153908.1 hypothetical protein [Leptolyngbya sp. FACHB-16]